MTRQRVVYRLFQIMVVVGFFFAGLTLLWWGAKPWVILLGIAAQADEG